MDYDLIYQGKLLKFDNLAVFMAFLQELKTQRGQMVTPVNKPIEKKKVKK